MKKIQSIGVAVICALACVSLGFSAEEAVPEGLLGEAATPQGVTLGIKTMQIGEWGRVPGGEPAKMTLVTYSVRNETRNKKIDLVGELDFRLMDEFGNVYHKLDTPINFGLPLTVPNKNYPSLYPDEEFFASVFFEAPVKASQSLFLKVGAANLGVLEPVTFRLPLGTAPSVPDKTLKASIPKKSYRVNPGDAIPIKVSLAEGAEVPDSIYIIAPFHLYEDKLARGNYKINIPEDQPEGPLTIVVLTKWGQKGSERTLSKSITVSVQKPCAGQCLESGGLAQGKPNPQLKKF